jgi:Skp family chaperone for outer membrane proteins
MTSKFLQISLVSAICLVVSASAQTGAAGSPIASAALPPTPTATAATTSGTRVGTINVERAVLGSNEGRRDFEALSKKLEPKQNDLKARNDELQGLQNQLQTQGDKLSGDALADLQKKIETKKKSFDRDVQDAQEDASNQQKDIFQRILQKMAPVIVKYAQDNGIGIIVDTSNPWPQSPVLWAGAGNDITASVVETYNAQSGVPAPATSGAAKPAAPKPAAPKPANGTPGSASKPAAPKSPEAPK